MKRIIYFFAGIFFLASCSNNSTKDAENKATPAEPGNNVSTAANTKSEFIYPIKHSQWEIGKPENINTVLDFYYAWDHKHADKVAQLFSDTIKLRIPTERIEIDIPNSKINEELRKNRKMYDSTSNDILSAVSLHDRESNEDWVMITTYNKWVWENGKRDSVLYQDNWKITNGKLSFLMSFYKLPTANFLKKEDPAK